MFQERLNSRNLPYILINKSVISRGIFPFFLVECPSQLTVINDPCIFVYMLQFFFCLISFSLYFLSVRVSVGIWISTHERKFFSMRKQVFRIECFKCKCPLLMDHSITERVCLVTSLFQYCKQEMDWWMEKIKMNSNERLVLSNCRSIHPLIQKPFEQTYMNI
jgi:hypothetical protein